MLTARVVTGLTLLAACLAALLLLPNRWWAVLLLVVILGAAWEWGALARLARPARWLFCATALASAVAIFLAVEAPGGIALEAVVYGAACVFWVVVAPVCLTRRWQASSPLAAAAVGWIVLLPAWLALTRLQLDPVRLLLLLGIVWLADTAAFFAGRAWGRRKLAPTISPGKTWEGVAGAMAAVAVYYVFLCSFTSANAWAAGWGGAATFAGVAAASVVGDLFESWMKRRAGVKDSGTLLPGHGGVLDRIDGLTASMPFAALMTRYLE